MLMQKQRKILFIIIRCCLIFLDHKTLFQLFLNCENSCVFSDPSFSFQTKIIFSCHTDWVTPSFIEGYIFTEHKDKCMGLTKIESYNCYRCELSG